MPSTSTQVHFKFPVLTFSKLKIWHLHIWEENSRLINLKMGKIGKFHTSKFGRISISDFSKIFKRDQPEYILNISSPTLPPTLPLPPTIPPALPLTLLPTLSAYTISLHYSRPYTIPLHYPLHYHLHYPLHYSPNLGFLLDSNPGSLPYSLYILTTGPQLLMWNTIFEAFFGKFRLFHRFWRTISQNLFPKLPINKWCSSVVGIRMLQFPGSSYAPLTLWRHMYHWHCDVYSLVEPLLFFISMQQRSDVRQQCLLECHKEDKCIKSI